MVATIRGTIAVEICVPYEGISDVGHTQPWQQS